MKSIITLVLLVIANFAWAQTTEMENLFSQLTGNDGYTTVEITKLMLEITADVAANEDKEAGALLKKLDGIQILTSESGENNTLQSQVETAIKKGKYELLMKINDSGEKVYFYLFREKDRIKEFIMSVQAPNENTLIMLSGDFNLKEIIKISKHLQIDDLKRIEKIESSNR